MAWGSHPANLLLRFILEVTALIAVGRFGFRLTESGLRYALALALPVVLATVWGLFAVPGDPSRSGHAPVPIHGALRLLLELCFFGVATWALYASDAHRAAFLFAGVTLVHYLISFDRVQWLLSR